MLLIKSILVGICAVMPGVSGSIIMISFGLYDRLINIISNRKIKENILFFITPPTHIKKFATGIGNCKKEMIIELFKATHKELAEILPKVDDIADAYYMSQYARHLYLEDNKEDNN